MRAIYNLTVLPLLTRVSGLLMNTQRGFLFRPVRLHGQHLIAKVLRFNPELNTRLSYAGNFFELLSSPFVTILLNVFVLFLFLSGYMLYQAKRAHTSFWVKMIMICGISGCLCSLIDKVFWGGSLDFLQIPTLFIFDLKDCYLTVAEVIFVVIGILNSKEISVKEYLHFCCNKFSL